MTGIQLENISEKIIEDFISACSRVSSEGLVRCSSGNMSLRLDDRHMLITATNSWMSDMTVDHVVYYRFIDNTVISDGRPSEEASFHAGIMMSRPDVNVVLHFQSMSATIMACMNKEPSNYCVIPEISHYIGKIAHIPYAPPGSRTLSEAVVSTIHGHDLAVLKNHGQVVVGKDYNDVIKKAVFFEMACRIILETGELASFIP